MFKFILNSNQNHDRFVLFLNINLFFFKDEEDEIEEEHNPKEVYKKMCDNLKVIPCRYFMAHIDNQKLTMKYHQFSNEEIRAISKPLWVWL